MNNTKKQPVVLTLDAGGTNFVFSAIKAGQEVVNPFICLHMATIWNCA
jgi:glucokinase